MNIHFFYFFFFFWGGGSEGVFLLGVGHGGCERRCDVFVKIKFKKKMGGGRGVKSGVWVGEGVARFGVGG